MSVTFGPEAFHWQVSRPAQKPSRWQVARGTPRAVSQSVKLSCAISPPMGRGHQQSIAPRRCQGRCALSPSRSRLSSKRHRPFEWSAGAYEYSRLRSREQRVYACTTLRGTIPGEGIYTHSTAKSVATPPRRLGCDMGRQARRPFCCRMFVRAPTRTNAVHDRETTGSHSKNEEKKARAPWSGWWRTALTPITSTTAWCTRAESWYVS